jgi:hypothetical protein
MIGAMLAWELSHCVAVIVTGAVIFDFKNRVVIGRGSDVALPSWSRVARPLL